MTQDLPKFIAAEVGAKTVHLVKSLDGLLRASRIQEIHALITQAGKIPEQSKAEPFTLAFIGQYNAGKSTLIKALTGRDDIAIDAGVCTEQVTAYSWHDVLLLDTPGVQAGQAEHDARTERAILDADLVVFVITAELFSESSARYFRRLMLDGGKAKESMLVVNKMHMDSGTSDAKRPDIDAVLSPLNSRDFHTVFMDAQCYLESLECADDEDRQELRDASGFDEFVKTLNIFVRKRCNLGRISRPLFQIRYLAYHAAQLAGADQPEERAAIELLGRLEACVSESKAQMRVSLNGALRDAVLQIERAGDSLASGIHEDAEEEELKKAQADSLAIVTKAREKLGDDVVRLVEEENMALQEKLAGIARSHLGQAVIEKITEGSLKMTADLKTNFGSSPSPVTSPQTEAFENSGWRDKADLAKKFGAMLHNWAAGPKAGGGMFYRASEVAGGSAHKVIYDVGKLFGAKFKPWEATKYAKWAGNIGKAIGAAAAVFAIVLEIREEQKAQEHQLKLRENRNDVRNQFQDMATDLSDAFSSNYAEYEKVRYGGELEALRKIRELLLGDLAGRGEESKKFVVIAAETDVLIRSLE